MSPRVAIFICTRNRVASLRDTLAAMSRVDVPADLPTELVVVDNGSSDGTAAVAREAAIPRMRVQYLYHEPPGKSAALNRAMASSPAEVLLHTDDDVRPPRSWVDDMCRPIAAGEARAVAGSVTIPAHLRRDWMETVHREWFLEYDFSAGGRAGVMIGANMAFAREVLSAVPGFAEELGPGAMGFSDDVLFSWMVQRAGYEIRACTGPPVQHHFDPSRLSRRSLLERARTEGRLAAYLSHHWLHGAHRAPRARLLAARLALAVLRRRRLPRPPPNVGCAEWELRAAMKVGFWECYAAECRGPRNFDKHGLVRRRPVAPDASAGRPGACAAPAGG